jgi:dipeptide/tripeptide permease
MLNTIEMWERLAYYNLRVMAPIYIMQADNPGGLHLTAMDKGTIYAWWAAFQSLLPDRHRRLSPIGSGTSAPSPSRSA